MPAGVPLRDLPPIDTVLLSHDHYDHLDASTVRHLSQQHPDAIWLAPLGLGNTLARFGVRRVDELDWWQDAQAKELSFVCVPAQHFSGRGLGRNATLWGGWVIRNCQHTCYFVGDTGSFPAIPEIGERCGPFDLILMPIGAYEPRWLMAPVHMNPEEAVQAYLALTRGSRNGRPCTMVAMHWGTFKLTTESIVEPPKRVRAAWNNEGLDERLLWIMAHGETRWLT